MRVIIAGAGQVGIRVARELDTAHDIVMIDVDPDRIDGLSYDLNVLTVTGDSSAIDTLREPASRTPTSCSRAPTATRSTSSHVARRRHSPT